MANKQIKFLKGLSLNMPAKLDEDVFYFCEDTGSVYLGTANGNVIYSTSKQDGEGNLIADTYASKAYVANAIANAQLGGDESGVDLSGLATKDELNSLISTINTKVTNTTQVNGKTLDNNIELTAEDVGARSITWLPSVEDVGGSPSPELSTVKF